MIFIIVKVGKNTIPMEARPDILHSYVNGKFVNLLKSQNFVNNTIRRTPLVQVLRTPYSQKMIALAAITLNIAGDICVSFNDSILLAPPTGCPPLLQTIK